MIARSSHDLSRLIDQLRSIKANVEREISALFQNRPVHIVGEITQILAQAS